jgi:hypothetical protein
MHPEVEFRNVSAGDVTVASRGREEFRALAELAVTLFASDRQTVREYGDDSDQGDHSGYCHHRAVCSVPRPPMRAIHPRFDGWFASGAMRSPSHRLSVTSTPAGVR